MLERIRSRLTYANVVATIALFIAIGTGSAYAANTIGGDDVIDGSLTGADIKNESLNDVKLEPNSVGSSRIKDNAVKPLDIQDGAVGTLDLADGGVANVDLATDSVSAANLQTDSVNATEVADNSIDSGEIVDFGLTNQDIGVLFAQVNADGTIANSSGGVTGTRIGAGTYAVDFGVNVSNCAFNATQGEAGVGGAGGAVMGVTDRSGNNEAVFVTSRTDASVLADKAFQLIVVC